MCPLRPTHEQGTPSHCEVAPHKCRVNIMLNHNNSKGFWPFLPLFPPQCVRSSCIRSYVKMHFHVGGLCVSQSSGRLCSTWLSDTQTLLPGLSSLASHKSTIPLPWPPFLPHHFSLLDPPLSEHTRGRVNLLFFVSNLLPIPALLLSPPYPLTN